MRVNEHVERLRFMLVSNVFLTRTTKKKRLLIDTGYVLERPTVLRELSRLGIGPSDLDGVLLTHRHSDHAGNARFFQRHGVPIICHARDADVLSGRAPAQPLSRKGRTPHALVAGALARVENRFPARVEVDRAVEDGDDCFGLEVRWMPGHTEGSAFFHHHDARTLFSGDTLLSALPPLVFLPGLALPYPTFSVDYASALESLARFLDLRPSFDCLCAGHGPPLANGASERVHRFLERKLS